MLRFSGRLIIASLLALAQPSASHGQTTFPTANGSSVPGAVMMCVDSATGLAAPVLVSGSTCPLGSGGGGGGAITAASGAYAAGSIASGAMVDLGVIADAASSAGGTGTVSAKLRLITTQLGTINTTLGSPFQTGGTVTANAGTNLNTSALALDASITTLRGQIPTTLTTAGADGVNNTLSGLQTYARIQCFNGTTWDRCTQVSPGTAGTASAQVLSVQGVASMTPLLATATLNAETTKVIGTVNVAAAQTIAVTNAGTFATQSALTATEIHAGEVSSNQIRVDVAQTVTASSAYTSGNAIGGLMTIAGASRVSGSLGAAGTGGIIQQVVANSKSLQTTQVDVFLFNSNPTGSTCTDKTAFVLATADFDKVIGVASVPGTAANNSGWFGGGTGSVGQANNLAMAFDLASGTSVFACAVTRGTPTFTATTDISFKYQILRN